MKFRLTVTSADHQWTETYDKPVGLTTDTWDYHHPSNPLRGRTLQAVEEWGKALVAWFNKTIQPGEIDREFVSAEIVTETP